MCLPPSLVVRHDNRTNASARVSASSFNGTPLWSRLIPPNLPAHPDQSADASGASRTASFVLKRTMPPKKNKKKAKAPSPPPDLNGAPVAAAPAAQAEAEQPAAGKVAASPLQRRR